MAEDRTFDILGHAVKRALLRGITRDQIVEACVRPEETKATYPNAKTGASRKRCFRRFGNQRLCVVLESGKPETIVTAYWMKS